MRQTEKQQASDFWSTLAVCWVCLLPHLGFKFIHCWYLWLFLVPMSDLTEKESIWDESNMSSHLHICNNSRVTGRQQTDTMAIPHMATEYVFSDFLLKDQSQARYRSVRTELAVDKMVTCVAVGLPLLLISLAFAQEVSVGEWLVKTKQTCLFNPYLLELILWFQFYISKIKKH